MVYKVIDADDFKKQLKDAGDKLVVVDFFATWCGPCRLIAPVLDEISKSNSNIVILKVDVDENEGISQDYNISSMPTFVFIKKGEKIDSFSGANESKIREFIAKHQ